jgi:putative transposase
MATRPNEVWACDFLHDRCWGGARFRCFSVLDEYTKECVALRVAPRITAERVVQALAAAVAQYGAPRYLRSDNGPEFTARRTTAWLAHAGIQAARIAPGQPWQNAVAESFHSRLRDECLSREWFATVAEAAVLVEQYRRAYNASRPHSALGYRTPAEVRADYDTKGDRDFSPKRREETERVPLLVVR